MDNVTIKKYPKSEAVLRKMTTDLSCSGCGRAIPGPSECYEVGYGQFFHTDCLPSQSTVTEAVVQEDISITDKA